MKTEIRQSAWIITSTGKKFFLLDPILEDIDIKDIAHGLALQCRWTGQCKHHYSIAQHSYYCSLIGPEKEALDRLLHDASEAYMGDMNRPLKHYTQAGEPYRIQEAMLQGLIRIRFGLGREPASVKIADNQMLFAERDQLMKKVEGDDTRDINQDFGTADIKICQWIPEFAETMFLSRFHALYIGK
jgi:uncharacterized protein